jgi:hypothetical protein
MISNTAAMLAAILSLGHIGHAVEESTVQRPKATQLCELHQALTWMRGTATSSSARRLVGGACCCTGCTSSCCASWLWLSLRLRFPALWGWTAGLACCAGCAGALPPPCGEAAAAAAANESASLARRASARDLLCSWRWAALRKKSVSGSDRDTRGCRSGKLQSGAGVGGRGGRRDEFRGFSLEGVEHAMCQSRAPAEVCTCLTQVT